jgi:5-formyltetrahydrofolate cyclo-ligase
VEKRELRGKIKHNLHLLPPALFLDEGLKAAGLLQNHSLFYQYPTVLISLSMNDEIDTLPIAELALAGGKKLFAPKVEEEKIRFYRILSMDDGPWHYGPFGIREPVPGRDGEKGRLLSESDFPALIIVPGLAFTAQGKRLGRGGGFYDRFLSELDTAKRSYTAIGLCMTEQVIDDLPTETWDRNMDGVLTGESFVKY